MSSKSVIHHKRGEAGVNYKFGKQMQPSTDCPRIKLNRNAFNPEQASVPKRRRLSRSLRSECTDRVANVPTTAFNASSACAVEPGPQDLHQQDPHQQEPARNSRNDQRIPIQSRGKDVHLHLAFSKCGGERSVNRDTRVMTSNSSGDLNVNAGSPVRSVANQVVIRFGLKAELPGKEDGRAGPNFNRNAGLRQHFGSISRLGSGRQVKRSVKNSCCALCGDTKYTPPACNKPTHLSQPKRLELSVVHPVARAKRKNTVIGGRRHLRVKLCDVAHVFGITSRDFSCILPAVLLQKRKPKNLNCFNNEYRSLMPLEPQSSRNCGRWIGNQSCEVCTPTNGCASLLSGNQVLGCSVGAHVSDGAEDIGRSSKSLDRQSLGMTDCERLSCNEEDAHLLANISEVRTIDSGAEGLRLASEEQQGNAAPLPSVLHLRRVNACNGFTSSQCLQHLDIADNLTVTKADTNVGCSVENGLNESSDEEVDFADCFSCQRTTECTVSPRLSCARTCRSWPFPRNGPPCELQSVIRTGPQWIVDTDTLKGGKCHVDGMQVDFRTSAECTPETNMKPCEGGNVQNSQGQVQSTAQTSMMLVSSLNKASNDQSETEKNTKEAWTSVNNEGEHIKPDPTSLDSVPDSQAVDTLCTQVINGNTPTVIPAMSSSATNTKSVVLEDSSITKSLISRKCLEEHENDTEVTIPPDIEQSASQTLSDVAHYGEEPQTSSVELNHCSSVMLQSKDDQKSDDGESSTRDTPYDSLSSSEEDSSCMSPAEGSDVGSSECSLLQDQLCETGQANRSPSPHPSPKGSAITGGELDVMRAYKEDAIVLDVIQDDPDLFGTIVMTTAENSLLKAKSSPLGKNMFMQTDRTTMTRKPNSIVWGVDSKRKDVQTDEAVHMENNNVFCKGQVIDLGAGSNGQSTFAPRLPLVNCTKGQMVSDCNNNQCSKERADLYVKANSGRTCTVENAHNNTYTAAKKDINIVRPLPSPYCWFYFSEHHVCFRGTCWFLHVPRDDDEKFCMDVLNKFCRFGSPLIVQRAEEIFVAYYKTNSPGVSFSENIVNQLLSCLLSLTLLKDLVSVINTLHTHKRTPPPEFVMALFEHVRQRGILNFVPELILLTSKIIEAGCVFSVEQCEMMQLHLEFLHVPQNQMDIFCTVKCRALATNPHTAELSELAQAVVRVELCKQQEDWAALARVFCSVFRCRHSAGELSRFGCCVTAALLKEPKDKLTLSYEPFAESVCQAVPADEMIKSFLGRVGVSLMFSYHRNHNWTKGVKLLRVMSRLQIEFALLKGLFNSEHGASRCQIVTTATEFFLNSGSIEGALNMLKANEWFVSSNAWPCEQADIQKRRRLLTLLSEKTSYRDTLEVLTNLPGLKQLVDGVQSGEYSAEFNAHLRRCVANHALPVGADTLDFMLTREIPVDPTELQQLLHRLGKQNSWTRARTLFKCAHSAGYYTGVVCERDSLALPCCLTEIEMTLAFERFITCTSLQNPSVCFQPLLITLNRGSSHEMPMESEYLAAGSRLLSAALIPNPKLSIRYTAVNQEQEQLFHLDRGSAAKWLSHNRSWAQGMWASSHTLPKAKTAF